jgi:hypothetical protein
MLGFAALRLEVHRQYLAVRRSGSQPATQFRHLEVPKSAAHPRLRSKSSIGTSKSSNTQAIRALGHKHKVHRPQWACVDAFSPLSLSHHTRPATIQVAHTSRVRFGKRCRVSAHLRLKHLQCTRSRPYSRQWQDTDQGKKVRSQAGWHTDIHFPEPSIFHALDLDLVFDFASTSSSTLAV